MPLSKTELARFDKALKQEKSSLLIPVGEAKELLISEKLSDEADIASVHLNQTIFQKLSARNALYMKKIDDALARVADGTYGECEGCGDDIGVKRLEARLTATLCIDCKAEQEKHEKLMKQTGGAAGWDVTDKTG